MPRGGTRIPHYLPVISLFETRYSGKRPRSGRALRPSLLVPILPAEAVRRLPQRKRAVRPWWAVSRGHLPGKTSMRLQPEESDAIDRRIAAVEAHTGVQVLAAVVPRSDSYVELPWKAFALGAS